MIPLGNQVAREQRTFGPLLVAAVVLGLVGLPVAVWLDLRNLSERTLRNQVSEVSRVIDDMRAFYGSEVVGRLLQAPPGPVTMTHNYRDVPGAIPIPATLSIELGNRISAHDGSVKYRFVSDLPFRGREAHPLDDFEQNALRSLRANPAESVVEASGSLLDRQIRVGGSGGDGRGLRELPQQPPGQPEDRLEGRRRAGHSGDLGHPAHRRQRAVVQISPDLFRPRGRWRA